MLDVNDVCDYMIQRLRSGGVFLSVLKVHKLLYYIQSWHLAYEKQRMFDEEFQAWVHGPVSRKIYDRFSPEKSLYSAVTDRDVREGFDIESLGPRLSRNIDAVLDLYGGFTGDQLEELTHEEDPWLEARGDLPPTARSEAVISDLTMQRYYAARLN